MRLLLSIVLAATVMIGCTQSKVPATTWEAVKLPGKSLALIDDSRIQSLRFTGDHVAATFGTQGGPIAGPILFWRISDGRLFISKDPDGDPIIDLQAPDVEGSVLTTTSQDGETLRYAVL